MSTDRNFHQFVGDDAGNIWYKIGDEPARQIFTADQPGMREFVLEGDVEPTAHIADALKLSGVRRFRLICTDSVTGGYEDVVDVNHSEDFEVELARAVVRGRFLATIKGGSRRGSVKVRTQVGHGKETDYDLGNWADQRKGERTVDIRLESYTEDQSPVKVRILHGWRPQIPHSTVQRYEVDDCGRGWFFVLFSILKKFKI